MTAKQWLNRARGIEKEIAKLKETQCKTREQVTSITQSYNSDGAQSSKDPHKFDRLAELDDLISTRMDDLIKVKAEILTMINQLSDRRQRLVLISYYVDGKTWEQTAVDLNYSYMHVTRIHGYALKEIEPLINML